MISRFFRTTQAMVFVCGPPGLADAAKVSPLDLTTLLMEDPQSSPWVSMLSHGMCWSMTWMIYDDLGIFGVPLKFRKPPNWKSSTPEIAESECKAIFLNQLFNYMQGFCKMEGWQVQQMMKPKDSTLIQLVNILDLRYKPQVRSMRGTSQQMKRKWLCLKMGYTMVCPPPIMDYL